MAPNPQVRMQAKMRPLAAAAVLAAVAIGVARQLAAAAEDPAWVAKVLDFRSSWPGPHAIGAAMPDFTLENLADGKSLVVGRPGRDGKPGGKGPDTDVTAE